MVWIASGSATCAITCSVPPAVLTEDIRTNILPPLSTADHILGWSVYLIST